MAAKCEFGQFLDDALRDRFVAGLRNPAIQSRLLKKKELTFETACQFAKSVELAGRELRGFRAVAGTDADVPAIKKTSTKPVSGSETRAAKNKCYRCGEEHDVNSCRYRKTRCYHYKRMGHLSRVCRLRQTTADAVHNVDDEQHDSVLLLYSVYHIGTTKRPYEVEVRLEGMPVKIQVDTGAAVSLLSESLFKLLKQPPLLAQCALKLKTYGGTPLEVIGQDQVAVEYNGQRNVLQIIVVPGDKPALLGRHWIESLGNDFNSIQKVHTELAPGLIKGFQAKLVLKEGSLPLFCKARPVPYAIREPVREELTDLLADGVLVTVTLRDWATPIVAVQKPDNKLRLCGDYKVSVNSCMKSDHYPLPTVEDLFTVLAGGKVFTVLDLSAAYQQIELHPDSRRLLTINTHMSLYQYVRMPYGISSAPAFSQAIMDELLKGLPEVVCYLDDVLITGATYAECSVRVEAVLQRLMEHGVKVREGKCKFFMKSAKYLGHIIDE
ncbi:uncharacterized protein K02A2.6-like [Ornithodoros turicata]|uniref:uncharacterized protein K02A2.6-like n=1 Tax=Ornithodoros turicata TaxID=34597 RepID=UPI00313A0B01